MEINKDFKGIFMWVPSKVVKEFYGITTEALKARKDAGKIEFKKIGDSNSYMYFIEDTEIKQYNIIYARVSDADDLDGLERQVTELSKYHRGKTASDNILKIIKEVGSSFDETRRGLSSLLDLVIKRKVNKIFITHPDRLSRYNYDFFKQICTKFGTEIVISGTTYEFTFQDELKEDLVMVLNKFKPHLHSEQKKIVKDTMFALLSIDDRKIGVSKE